MSGQPATAQPTAGSSRHREPAPARPRGSAPTRALGPGALAPDRPGALAPAPPRARAAAPRRDHAGASPGSRPAPAGTPTAQTPHRTAEETYQ
ncbi:hypothetical protein OOK31_29555 [Streptomyces sp. NBC_00249]|uniref:hypothetical protein n=1 Tax=Streptomyces sp. NBC_00249 TaxID=2975690 RepID=UPI002257AC87|nr:hypothetical protein [Streptomyces sp. NBC_00249]MCX5197990.1 hypothetical protein [Streptomyces sp. NBC_00249]